MQVPRGHPQLACHKGIVDLPGVDQLSASRQWMT
jgi:hypothetical protein